MFEIEKMEQQFDYSLVDNDTADFLRSCEYEINGIAEDARVKFGAVLIKAQDELAKKGYGIFIEWVTSGGISKDDAYYYINLNRTSRNLDKRNKDNFLKAPKTVQKKVMQKNTPEEVKQAVFSGEVKTNKELEELNRQLKQREQENDILQKQLEEAENKPAEVIEKYMEVVPEDYEGIKEQLKEVEEKKEEYRKQLMDMYLSKKEREEKSQKYDELNEAINSLDMKLSENQQRLRNRKFVHDLISQSRVLMKEVAPLTYSIDSLHADDLKQMTTSLSEVAGELYKISKDIKSKIREGVIVNE